jgi:hypothetical protein
VSGREEINRLVRDLSAPNEVSGYSSIWSAIVNATRSCSTLASRTFSSRSEAASGSRKTRTPCSSITSSSSAGRGAADANFASTHGGKSFQQFYGTNGDLSNAFGNCVLKKLQASTAKLTQALVKASKTCKALRRSDPATFRQRHGSRPNAFAKCVSAQAKLK